MKILKSIMIFVSIFCAMLIFSVMILSLQYAAYHAPPWLAVAKGPSGEILPLLIIGILAGVSILVSAIVACVYIVDGY